MSVKWTEAQRDAIDARDRSILVCAAAGSGKTATLTERIIKRLTDKEKPSDISRMLVVTFTRNAAAELKEKIYKALSLALEADPKNKALSMQLIKLPSAKISTIHSFCFDIVKRNAEALGLPSLIKNEGAAEGELRARRVMNEVVSDFYDKKRDAKTAAEFARLAESITDAKSEGTLAEVFLSLYKSLCSYHGGAQALRRSVYNSGKEQRSEFFDTAFGKAYKDMLFGRLGGYTEKYSKIIRELSAEDPAHPYLFALEADRQCLEGLLLCIDEGYGAVSEELGAIEFESLGRIKKDSATISSENAKALRSAFKAEIRSIKPYFEYSEDDLEYASIETGVLSMTLAEVLCEFELRFRQDKKEAGVLDYNDLEYYAERVLYKNGEPSDAAREIADLTDEIYIDEYQDVNEVQDRIFSAVSNGHNLFTVGDVKQSIYSFRGGEPSIFISRRDSYPHYERGQSLGEPCSIFMQNNFRCSSKIVDFVNGIFATLLGEANGRFKYIDEDALIYSKNEGKVSENEEYPRFIICEDDGEVTKGFSGQAAFVAEEIVRLIKSGKKDDGTPIKPEDIAILLRSDKGTAPVYKRELERRGVPVTTGDKEPFYNSSEVKLALCLLNAIDNPHRDIYLAGALLSGVYSFTLDELARIKHQSKDKISLFDALLSYACEHEDEKCRAFIEKNNAYRENSRQMSVDELIWHIYEQEAFVSMACVGVDSVYERRRIKKNCMALYDCARNYEAGGYRGLYSFLEYMESMMKNKLGGDTEREFSDGCVKIMSIHASKGLEFPVCFVCETQKSFNREDIRHGLLYDRDIGLGFKLRQEGSVAVLDTPHRKAVGLYKKALLCEEEMRILYVALTRARERLYITAGPQKNSSAERMLEHARFEAEYFSGDTVRSLDNFALGMLMCIYKNSMPISIERVSMSNRAEPSVLDRNFEDGGQKKTSADSEKTERALSLLRERMDYSYPYELKTKIKAKMSVSKLYPGVLDEDADELEETEKKQVLLAATPDFLKKEKAPDGKAKGTATHLILQFADFDEVEKNGIDGELERLVERGFIDKETAEIADREQIKAFFESGFFERIKKAQRLWREFRFNLLFDASLFTEDKDKVRELEGEKLLVQGVIDGFFMENGKIVLFDYKTDFLSDYELIKTDIAEKKLCERHRQQLYYYKIALEQIFGGTVSEVYIYSLSLKKEVKLDI